MSNQFTLSEILRLKLKKLEIGQSISKSEFIEDHSDHYDNVLDENKCFDNILVKVRKTMPEKEFKTINGLVTRIK